MDHEKKFRFRKFPAYQAARIFNREIKTLSKSFPGSERFLLTSQLHRALDSVVLNIAEGSDRSTDKDFAHFLNTAHSSINEVVACLDIALDSKYIEAQVHQDCLASAAVLANQLTAFRSSLVKGQKLNVKG